MKQRKIAAFAAASVLALSSFSYTGTAFAAVQYRDVTFNGITVNGGEAVAGVDISSVISLEKSGVVFKDNDGNPQDIFLTLKNAGVNYIRVRVWNKPETNSGLTYGGGANDIGTAVEIAKRCSKYGLKLLVDFHYSDFWADPGKQRAPKEWANYSVDQKCDAVKKFTADCLDKLKSTGAEIGMVQVGNETNGGLCGEKDWQNICRIMNAGSSAIRNFDRNILVAVHFTNPEKSGNYDWIAGNLDKYKTDYDVFASSYYPYWHGTPENLTSELSKVASKYGKYVMVAETSWANTFEDSDQFANTIGDASSLGNYVSYDISVQGQIEAVTKVFEAVADVGPKGIGAFYWEPAWITVGNDRAGNLALWEKNGSGWATKAAAEYDPDAGQWYGGSAVDNQALFSADGKPLDSLYIFSHIKSGNQTVSSDNLITDPGFENGGTGWKLENTTSGEYAKFEINDEMTHKGGKAAHWYSANAFEYTGLYAEYTAPETGKYRFTDYLAGEKTSYKNLISVNGDHRASDEGTVTAYDKWNKSVVEFTANKGDTIGIWIELNGEAGGYGSVDDCELCFTGQAEDVSSPEPTVSPSPSSPEPPQSPEPAHSPDPTAPSTPVSKDDPIKGDLNGDRKVNASDLVIMHSHMLGGTSLSDTLFPQADMDYNGKVNIADLLLLKERILDGTY